MGDAEARISLIPIEGVQFIRHCVFSGKTEVCN